MTSAERRAGDLEQIKFKDSYFLDFLDLLESHSEAHLQTFW